jgi:enoyl-CoA hydratase/carnithine racemase
VTEGIHIRTSGRAGRITLDRPEALNAVTHDMVMAIEAALRGWVSDNMVAVVIIDAVGEKAFCAGGDVTDLYAAGRAGDHEDARRFWRGEYRMNARVATYPKPVVTFLQGYTLGGGVGVGCHAHYRIVGTTSRIAMPLAVSG